MTQPILNQGLLALFLLTYFAAMGGQKNNPAKDLHVSASTEIKWHSAQEFGVRGLGWTELQETYTRLPAKAQGEVTPAVWNLSKHSAGVHVRFVTTSQSLKVKWSVRSNNSLNHMAATAVKGVDLYAWSGKCWRWVGVGKPSGYKNEKEIVTNMAPGEKEFLLYLPLYDGVDSVYIGVEKGAVIKSVGKPKQNPIVFYGTSITQGACASRAGMAYPAIIGRELNQETINLGFSGNGKMDVPMAKLLAELDPSVYVLDCLPNLKAEEVLPRTLEVIKLLRASRPHTPILLVPNITYAHAWIDQKVASLVEAKNNNLQQAFKQLKAEGVENIYCLDGKKLMLESGEGTVDGIHLTDLGFANLACVLMKEIKSIQKKNKIEK